MITLQCDDLGGPTVSNMVIPVSNPGRTQFGKNFLNFYDSVTVVLMVQGIFQHNEFLSQ